MLGNRKRFRAVVLVAVFAAAVCGGALWLALPGPAPGASYTKPWKHPVPSATRFCGQGGDPAAPGNGADPRGVAVGSPNPLRGLRFYVHPVQDDAYRQLVKYEMS